MNSDLYKVIYKAVKSAVVDTNANHPESDFLKKYLTFETNVLYLELESGLDLTDPDCLASKAFDGWCLAVMDEVVNDLPGYTDDHERDLVYQRSAMATQPFSRQDSADKELFRYIAEKVIAAYGQRNEIPLEKYENEEVSL